MPLSPLSQPGSSGRLPTAPTSVTATAVSGGEGSTGSANVSWAASLNPGRATGTYVVRSYDSGNNAGPTASVSASATSVSVTGLTIGTDYTFKVELQSPYGLNSDQSSATSPAIRAFRRPTINASTKGAGTAVAVTSMSHSGKNDTWGRTYGSTTTSATGGRSLTFSKVSGTGTPTLTTSGNDCNITGMAEDSTYNFRATWTNSRSSGVRITTSVNPQGRSTNVSLSWGYSNNYTTYSATSGGSATVNIGSGSSAVTTEWVIDDSAGGDRVNTETLYFRVTATNSVDTARTSDDTHTTVATSTYSADTGSLKTQKFYDFKYNSDGSWIRSTYKDSYHEAPVLDNFILLGGGGGGGRTTDGRAGGGGGGDKVTAGALTPGGNVQIYVGSGGGGAANGSNGWNGGTSSVYNLSTSSNHIAASGGSGGQGGTGLTANANGGAHGGGNGGGSATASEAGYYYFGGGGGGEGGAGSNASSTAPGTGGAGSSEVPSLGGGGGGSGQLFLLTNPPFGGEWRYYGASDGAGGGYGAGSGGTTSEHAGNGGANLGGGGGGQAYGNPGYLAGNGGSGFVRFTFYGK